VFEAQFNNAIENECKFLGDAMSKYMIARVFTDFAECWAMGYVMAMYTNKIEVGSMFLMISTLLCFTVWHILLFKFSVMYASDVVNSKSCLIMFGPLLGISGYAIAFFDLVFVIHCMLSVCCICYDNYLENI